MSKSKKYIIIAIILIITCAAASVISIALYDNFAPTQQDKLIMSVIGEENAENITGTYKYRRIYFYKDGTTDDSPQWNGGDFEIHYN